MFTAYNEACGWGTREQRHLWLWSHFQFVPTDRRCGFFSAQMIHELSFKEFNFSIYPQCCGQTKLNLLWAVAFLSVSASFGRQRKNMRLKNCFILRSWLKSYPFLSLTENSWKLLRYSAPPCHIAHVFKIFLREILMTNQSSLAS